MKVTDIKTIDDLRDYIKPESGFQFSNKNTPFKTLTLKFKDERKEDDIQWNIWDTDLEKIGRYPFINSIPKLMLFKKKTLDIPYTTGIIIPINFESVIKSITFDELSKTINIEVFENAYYWRFDRNELVAVKKIFRNYETDVDYTITEGSKQMDSQSPSHPPFGGVGGLGI